MDVLPKNVRKKKKVRKYLRTCRRLFRSTTAIRDIDVVCQNVETRSSSPRVLRAISKLHIEREQLIQNTRKLADDLEKISFPRFKKKELSSRAILKRKDKIIEGLIAKLQEELPIVAGDFRKIGELHDMRKECKKLRYTLELFPSHDNSVLTSLMKNWQTILGTIRDIDITEQFAEEKGLLEELEGVLMSLRINRDRMLGSFRGTAKLSGLTIPAGQL
jgi:CHAD domain-containing protein